MRRPRRSRRKSRRLRVIRLWTYPDALRAVPYLNRVLGSVREHWLTMQRQRVHIDRLGQRRADRDTLIRLQDAERDSHRATENFRDSLRELRKIDVFLLDPVQGIAFIPFQRDEELAWMIYDRFDERGLTGWRWHKDALETSRPLAELDSAPPASSTFSLEA
jgi:hypothetical protein